MVWLLFFNAERGIRTPVARRRLVYSQVQLTALPSPRIFIYSLTRALTFETEERNRTPKSIYPVRADPEI